VVGMVLAWCPADASVINVISQETPLSALRMLGVVEDLRVKS